MSKEEAERRDILIEGLACIQQGKNPKIMKAELYAYANITDAEAEANIGEEVIRTREVARQQ